MSNTGKHVLAQLIWLISLYIISYILLSILSSALAWDINMHDNYINWHDTMVVLPFHLLVVPVFIVSIFLVFVIKEIPNKFSKPLPNAIIIFSGILMFLMIVYLQQIFITLGDIISMSEKKVIVYPPLSTLSQQNNNVLKEKFINNVSVALYLVQFITLLMVFWVAYKLVKHKLPFKA